MKSSLRVNCFMHVPFEGPGLIRNWTDQKGHHLKYTRFYENETLPEQDSVDFLVIMGGPMNVLDYHIHPWMQDEIDWVVSFIKAGKPVLGICLGAQIIATALGSEVFPGKEKEIGWYNIRFLPSMGDYKICKTLPSARKVFHWHGDTFHIPEGAVRIAESTLFPNQGFIYGGHAIALQFHLELTQANVEALVENCRNELLPAPYIQTEKELLNKDMFMDENQQLLFSILDYLAAQ